MSDQPLAPESARATSAGDAVRPIDPVEGLGGLAARTAAGGSVWGPRAAAEASADGTSRPPAGQAASPVQGAAALDQSAPSDMARAATPEGRIASPAPVIGRISRVKGSDLWPNGTGLAGWLAASPEPLAEVLGKPPFEFASSGTNILTGTSADQHPVCVVCEVGPSSDEALGVLLRVAAVQEGGLVVWIAGAMGDAHVAALSWLNRSTSPRFYLVKVTGIRIDGSASAPIFELVARPPRSAAPAPAATTDGGPTARPVDAPRRRAEDHVPES